jgi:hypothetical protein
MARAGRGAGGDRGATRCRARLSLEPETDGQVLTLSPRFLVEGEFEDIGNAFRDLFCAPGVLHFSPDDAEA